MKESELWTLEYETGQNNDQGQPIKEKVFVRQDGWTGEKGKNAAICNLCNFHNLK
jgi:hypothetical protein